MDEEHDFFLNKEEYSHIIEKCEHMLAQKTEQYFDVHEFAELIDYYIDNGKLNKAYTVASIALKQHPHNVELEFKKAKIHIERNDGDSALSVLKNLYTLEPENSDILFLMGIAYSIKENFTKALEIFNLFIEIEGDDELEEHYYTIAINFINTNQYKHALFYLQQAYTLNKDNFLVIYDLAFCYEKLGKYKKSIQLYLHYLDLDPYSENAWYNLGVIYSEIKKYNLAIEAFDYAIAIDDTFSSAYFNKGNCFAAQNFHEKAVEIYQEYLQLEKKSLLGHLYIGESYEKIKDYEQGEAHFFEAVNIDSDCEEAWFGLAMIKFHMSDITKATEFIRKTIELNPLNEKYWLTYGIMLKQQEMFDNAIGAIKKAIDINPDIPESWIELSEIYFTNKLYSKAREVLVKAHKNITHKNATVLYTLAAYTTYTDKSLKSTQKYFKQAYALSTEKSSIFFNTCNQEPEILKKINNFIQKIL
ncbi:MAG: tetratricopeptide repeat protein [Bacteroidales bacterium]